METLKPLQLSDFKLSEIQILVAAYCYEHLETSVMSDSCFDILSTHVAPGITEKIQTFVMYSGMWVRDIEIEGLHELSKEVARNVVDMVHIPMLQTACAKQGVHYMDRAWKR